MLKTKPQKVQLFNLFQKNRKSKCVGKMVGSKKITKKLN
tara:strand:- start:323 stop:439 length:117 start_codon:yes stop_codon:yes gene_type:complete